MSSLQLQTRRMRPKSAISNNYKNVELHSCLNDAKQYKDQVSYHLKLNEFQNHVLESAQRKYKQEAGIRSSKSLVSFKRTSSTNFSMSKVQGKISSSNQNNLQSNPQVFNIFQYKASKVTQIKNEFQSGLEQKMALKERMDWLKKVIVEEKNRKAKISIRNCKLMNQAELSNHRKNRLQQQSRRNVILINELVNDIYHLEEEKQAVVDNNSDERSKIIKVLCDVDTLNEIVSENRRILIDQRYKLQNLKEDQTVIYKEMTNHYMVMNQLKEEKAWLLNSIQINVFNNS